MSASLPRPAQGADRIEALSAICHVILDRDGVLNLEPSDGGYVARPDQFHWLPGARDAIVTLSGAGMRVSVATNQSGIGRGLMSEHDLAAVHDKMTAEVREARGSIDAIFYCPHAPEAGCSCRKPLPGLIESAIAASGISHEHTLLVGDAARDLEAARSAGVRAALLRTGKGREHESYAAACEVPVFDDLRALAAELTRAR